MQGEEERKSAVSSDVKMTAPAPKAAETSMIDTRAQQNTSLPNSTSNIEEDWRRLKQQNLDLNNEIRTTDASQTLNS